MPWYSISSRNIPVERVLTNWNFYISFSFFRITAILQGVYRRAHDGQVCEIALSTQFMSWQRTCPCRYSGSYSPASTSHCNR